MVFNLCMLKALHYVKTEYYELNHLEQWFSPIVLYKCFCFSFSYVTSTTTFQKTVDMKC